MTGGYAERKLTNLRKRQSEMLELTLNHQLQAQPESRNGSRTKLLVGERNEAVERLRTGEEGKKVTG